MEPWLATAWALPGAMLATGFLSGVHCVGMCGGIVGAFSARGAAAADGPRPSSEFARQLAFNTGRISAYALAGATAGAIGGAGSYLAGALPWQTGLYVLANIMLILVGLHLAGAGRWLARLESIGTPLWRRLQPLAARMLPARTLPQAWAAGALWGWLPCGLVYAALVASAFAGSAQQGAIAMIAFGLGTLPNLLAAGLLAARLRRWSGKRALRVAAGGVVLGFGVFGLAHAGTVAESIRVGLLCL